MKLEILVLAVLALLVRQGQQVTALTTANCPTDYNIAAFNATSSSSLVNLIFSNLYSKEEQAKL